MKEIYMTDYVKIFSSFLKENQIKINEPMKRHTTFGIGGPADCFLIPETTEEMQRIIKEASKEEIPLFILGGGANLLVRDKGIRGLVVYTGRLQKIEKEGNLLHVNAGVPTIRVAEAAAQYGLSGLEFAGGIPGSIGGAVYMNAGAYIGEMSQVVTSVISYDGKGDMAVRGKDEIGYSYRNSLFMRNKEIISEITLELVPGDRLAIQNLMNDFNARRREKQPLDKKSAGSTFKRPEGHFVGQMIEELQMKGFSVGDAQVSTKHAGFLINNGNASFNDMITLIQEVQNRVKAAYGVELKTEVQMIGEE